MERSKIDFQDGGYGGHFGFPIGMILAILIYPSNLTCCYIVSFNLIRLVVCEKMSKTDFQGGIFKVVAVAAILVFRSIRF